MNQPNRRRQTLLVLFVLVVAVAAIAITMFRQHRFAEQQRDRIAAARQQIELKNRGIGFLENGKYEQADAAFSTLAEQLSFDPLGRRNLAITRLLAVEDVTGDNSKQQQLQAALAKAAAAIDTLLSQDADDPYSHLLAGDLAGKSNDPERAVQELTAAASLAPQDATIQFKLYTALRYSNDEAQQRLAQNALHQAAELVPNNIFVQPQWLAAQAAAKDPQIVETFKRIRQILGPFAAGIEQRSRFNVLDAIDNSLAAVAAEDWPTVVRNAAGIGNVVRPEAMSHIDRSRINPHLLEYVLFEFDQSVFAKLELPEPQAPPTIDIKFIRTDEELPKLKDIRELELADFDLDGDLELIVLADAEISVWKRSAEAGPWKTIASLDIPAGMRGFVTADLDRDDKETPARPANDMRPCLDADIDIVAYGKAGSFVLKNQLDPDSGNRTLILVKQEDAFNEIQEVLTAALADVDHDGDLDLSISAQSGMSIWSNRDDFTFGDISNRSALPPENVRPTKIIPVDWNRDVAIDLMLVDGESGKAGYLQNQMHGSFRWREIEDSLTVQDEVETFDIAELDGNPSWDITTIVKSGIVSATSTTLPDGNLVWQSTSINTITGLNHLITCDADNDGIPDRLFWNDSDVVLFRGLPDGSFEDSTPLFEGKANNIADCVTGDFDNDGDLDLFVASADGIALYRNDGGNTNGWINTSLSADPNKRPSDASKRVNMHGIGSLLELKSGLRYQAQVVTGKTTHFGLGSLKKADVLRVLWTNGVPENFVDPERETAICAKQDLKGSCPYIYTWDGEKYSFFTDLLWASPIGLQFAEGVLAPAREWEYLKIPGDKLREVDGEYWLQLTEELWEAAYFDRVKLIAVDHPGDIDIYTNEKVGPPQIAAHQIHTVRHPRIPVAARDKHDRDVLSQITRRDDKYLKAFDGRILQGLTDESFIELDLGKLGNPDHITLFLTGWVFPTDTSLNVAISHAPKLSAPKPPSIQVPDGAGGWKEAIPYTGFPGGKTKTIAIDISNIFPPNDYRLRIVTSMQLYWDQIFFTVDEQPEPVNSVELPLIAADLHYRGFNRRIEHSGNGPESYDYNDVDPGPKWPPMAGRFTRYGDVTALLQWEDDQLLVMGAGDEVTLRFHAPAAKLPSGWRRDFILYNVGWDKDADLNTVYGQTVEPLPFRAMRRYPFPLDQPPPDTREYRDYLKIYQTRTHDSAGFWKALVE